MSSLLGTKRYDLSYQSMISLEMFTNASFAFQCSNYYDYYYILNLLEVFKNAFVESIPQSIIFNFPGILKL